MKSAKERQQLLDRAIQQCRDAGLRRTIAMKEALQKLIAASRPLSISEVANAMHEYCDKVTVYRLLDRLEKHGVVRRVGLHEREGHYTMRYPDEHSDYLICTECGSVESIDVPCPVGELEKELSERSGFRDLYHELEFFGVCPKCAG